MALDIDTASDDPTLYVGEKFAVHGGDVVLPPLPRWVFSQAGSSHKVVREMILEELTRSVHSQRKFGYRWSISKDSLSRFLHMINRGLSFLWKVNDT